MSSGLGGAWPRVAVTEKAPMDVDLTMSQPTLHPTLVAPAPTCIENIIMQGQEGEHSKVQYVILQKEGDLFSSTGDLTNAGSSESDVGPGESVGNSGADSFQCGICFLLLHDIIQFLHHKSTHVGRGHGLGCELCGMSFSRQRPLLEHYRRSHNVTVEPCHKNETHEDNDSPGRDAARPHTQITTKHVEILRPPGWDSRANLVTEMKASITSAKQNQGSCLETSGLNTVNITDSSTVPAIMTSQSRTADTSLDALTSKSTSTCASSGLDTASNKQFVSEKIESTLSTTDNRLVFQVATSGEKAANKKISDRPPEGSSMNDLNMPDFHFVSRIAQKTGTSIQYGKHYFKCLYCDTETYWRNAMCRHMQEKHRDILTLQPYMDVPAEFITDGQVIIKMSDYISQKYAGLNTYRPNANKRIRKQEKQDLPGDFPCHLCTKVFHRLRYLRVHIKTHQANKEHLCPVCGKHFKLKLYLTQHLRTHTDKDSFKCQVCDFTSNVKHLIHAHRQIHRRGSVLCDICGLAYSDKCTLSKHRRVHDESRPYCCKFPGCTWRFKSEALCQGHFKAHTVAGKHVCQTCGYAFRKKHHLNRHMKKQHNMLTGSNNSSTSTRDDLTVPAVEVQENQSVETACIGQLNIHDENIGNMHGSLVASEENIMTSDSIVNEHDTIVEDQLELENALQTGQLVIATEVGYGEESNMNYEMSDIGLNTPYRMLLQQSGVGDSSDSSKGILIPQTDGTHVFFQHEATETVESENQPTDSHVRFTAEGATL